MTDTNLVAAALEGAAPMDIDSHRNAPRPDPACLYGLIGEIARAGSENTEANPYAVALNAMAYLSCAVGRGPYMPIGNTWHHARLFTLQIGRSGEGRKGDAVSLTRRIERRVREIQESLAPQVHSGGLSSREGLAFLIHDGYREGREDVPPVQDKRLWVIESEFVNVLQQGKREGNTLSPALRDCWDGVSIRPATKSSRMWASDPHICLSGAITPSELRACIASRDLTNGFMNRLLPIWAERDRVLPFPKATPDAEVNRLAERVAEVLRFISVDRWVERDTLRMSLAAQAATRWAVLYKGELNDRGHGERINALIERRAPMLLRIAMLLALTDLSAIVEVAHLDAALAWIRYSVESVKYVFSTGEEEAQAQEVNTAADKILRFVGSKGRATRWQLTSDCFKGHASKDQIDAALDELLLTNPPRIEMEEDRSKPGRPTKFYSLPAKNAKNAKNEYPCGLAPDFEVAKESEESEVMGGMDGETSQTSQPREQSNRPGSRASTDSEQFRILRARESENRGDKAQTPASLAPVGKPNPGDADLFGGLPGDDEEGWL